MSSAVSNLWKPVGTEWFPGWYLIGRYESDVGSWLLHHDGEAMLLEIPEGLKQGHVRSAIKRLDVHLCAATSSHNHEDHMDCAVWANLAYLFPHARRIRPGSFGNELRLTLGGEPLYLISAPKHSRNDTVAVFRGVAMTGDIELNTLDSVNSEVSRLRREMSMEWLRTFEERNNYRVHSIVSAHLNDVRTNINFSDLFKV